MLKRAILAACLYVCGAASAQAQAIRPVPPNADLPPAADAQLGAIRARKTTESVSVVRITPGIANRAEIDVAFADRSPLLLSRKSLSRSSANVMAWTGETAARSADNSGLPAGDATLVVNGNRVSGVIRGDAGTYTIQPLANGLHALVKVKEEAIPPDHPTGREAQSRNDTARDVPDLSALPTTPVEITVLVAYTKDAVDAVTDPQGLAQLAVDEANKSYANSGVMMKLRLVEVVPTKYAGSSHDADLDEVSTSSTALGKTIAERRDATKADLVILMNTDEEFCGLAKDIFAGADTAFATVWHDCAVTNLSFPHEIGHLLGACHDPDTALACKPFGYGHGYRRTDIRRRSVMAYPCASPPCPRVAQWSRPPEWGTADKSHDQRVLNETVTRASKFR